MKTKDVSNNFWLCVFSGFSIVLIGWSIIGYIQLSKIDTSSVLAGMFGLIFMVCTLAKIMQIILSKQKKVDSVSYQDEVGLEESFVLSQDNQSEKQLIPDNQELVKTTAETNNGNNGDGENNDGSDDSGSHKPGNKIFKMLVYAVLLLFGIYFALLFIVYGIGQSQDNQTQVLFGLVILVVFVAGLILSFAFLPGLLALVLGGAITFSAKGEKEGRKPIFFQVPKNHVWVVRWFLFTNPGKPHYIAREGISENHAWRIRQPSGYIAWTEGLKPWIPGLQVDEGVVSLAPRQRNILKLKVNSKDGQIIYVDSQLTTYIGGPKRLKNYGPKRFLLSVPGDTIEEKEEKRISIEDDMLHTALANICEKYTSEDNQNRIWNINDFDYPEAWRDLSVASPSSEVLQRWFNNREFVLPERIKKYINGEEREVIPIPIDFDKETICEMKKLRIPELYGLKVQQVGIQQILNPDDIQEALERERKTRIDLRAADNEADTMDKIIQKTKANPNMVVLKKIIDDGIRIFVANTKSAPRKKSGDTGGKSK